MSGFKLFMLFASLFFIAVDNLHASEYVAFSLKVAQEGIVSTLRGEDYCKLYPEVFTFGGITAVRDLVYDRQTGDIILVGERILERAVLTLDDFVVALRARFILAKWPLGIIDPIEETEIQIVRLEGGIEDTQFGEDLFDANYRLKRMGIGLLSSGVPGLQTYWDLGMGRAKEGTDRSYKISSRFCFYPVLPSVLVREDVVAIKGFKVGVFKEVLSAEIEGRPKGVELNKDYLQGYITDTKSILTSPSRWEKADWLKASLVAGVTIGLYAYDRDIQDWAQKKRNSTTNDVARLISPFGNRLVTLPALGVFYLYGHSQGDKKARSTALLSLESFLLSSVFTQAIKFTTHRYRPSEGNQDKWDGPSFSTSHLSFPSWESSSAFAIGTVIASEYRDNAWVPPLAYGIAALTALSRVNDNDHWASDVFFGSAIGFFTAKAIVALHKKDINLAVIPVIDGQLRGLAISYKF